MTYLIVDYQSSNTKEIESLGNLSSQSNTKAFARESVCSFILGQFGAKSGIQIAFRASCITEIIGEKS